MFQLKLLCLLTLMFFVSGKKNCHRKCPKCPPVEPPVCPAPTIVPCTTPAPVKPDCAKDCPAPPAIPCSTPAPVKPDCAKDCPAPPVIPCTAPPTVKPDCTKDCPAPPAKTCKRVNGYIANDGVVDFPGLKLKFGQVITIFAHEVSGFLENSLFKVPKIKYTYGQDMTISGVIHETTIPVQEKATWRLAGHYASADNGALAVYLPAVSFSINQEIKLSAADIHIVPRDIYTLPKVQMYATDNALQPCLISFDGLKYALGDDINFTRLKVTLVLSGLATENDRKMDSIDGGYWQVPYPELGVKYFTTPGPSFKFADRKMEQKYIFAERFSRDEMPDNVLGVHGDGWVGPQLQDCIFKP